MTLRVEKAGQDNMQCFDYLDGVLAYSDSECTRLLTINGYDVSPLSWTKEELPAASRLQLFKKDDEM